MLSFVEPYVGKYFSTEYVRSKILRQTEEEIRDIDDQMQIDKQKLQAEQMALMAQQQAQGQPEEQQQ
jgi:hypothetical protein